jgi:tetratricopeptide (TPR) repeat protein
MKKETGILVILIALVIGFVTGSTIAILKRSETLGDTTPLPITRSPLQQEPPSIEDTEKFEELKEDLRKDPKNSSVWLKLGNRYADYNKYREAVEAYNQYLAIKPDDPDVRTKVGALLRNLGDIDGAIQEFRRAAQISPRHSESRYYLGITLLHDKGDIREAIKVLEEYLKVEPNGERADRVRVQLEKMNQGAK